MIISLIVAVADGGVIGNDGGIPWHVSEDMRYFKKVTMGKPVIMGRKTWQSMGKPLPGRDNIVISTTMKATEGIEIVRNLDAALSSCEAAGAEEAVIIGGAGLYAQGLEIAQRLYLTEIHASFEGDTFFPILSSAWVEVSRNAAQDRRKDDPDYSFVIFERRD